MQWIWRMSSERLSFPRKRWLRTDLDASKGPVNTDVLTEAESDRMVNFEFGKLAWETPHEVYEDHLRYLSNDIIKPLVMIVKEMVLRFNKVYTLKKYLSPPYKRDEDATEADWDKLKVPVTFDEQRRSQFNALPTSYKESLRDKDEDLRLKINKKGTLKRPVIVTTRF